MYNAESIKVLEGLEAVRLRPGMYIGSTENPNHLLYEIVDNCVDEYMAGYCKKILVCLHEDGSAEVKDDGRGIPVDMHEKGVPAERVILTTLHAGGKFDSKSYQVSGGLHGVGSSVVNALSSYMDVEVSIDGKVYHDRYERGEPTVELQEGLLPAVRKARGKGTRIRFLPDPGIFQDPSFETSAIKNRLHEMAYLNAGLSIHFINEKKNEDVTFREKDGLKGFVRDLNEGQKTLTSIIPFKGESNGIQVEGCLQYVDSFTENILGFCNSIYTEEGGTHLTGFKNRYTSLINSYAKTHFPGADVRSGMIAVIYVKHPNPVFEGQTKTKLNNADAREAVSSVTGEQLSVYFDKHPKDVKTICSLAKRSGKIRQAETKKKENLLQPRTKFSSNGKLANCESKDKEKCEIFIVEGDSAGGSAKTARNRKYQAVLPIRGKILNVEKASIDKILANEEIKTMIYAFGCGFSEGYGNDFDITKLRYDKIILMTDADVDGSHINTLLLTFFYRFMPELIQTGHIYIAMPPLYKAKSARKECYLYDDKELNTYRKKHKKFDLQRYKGLGEMDAKQLWETTMDPETRLLKQVEIQDMVEANRITALLMGKEAEKRREYISENASFARLDI